MNSFYESAAGLLIVAFLILACLWLAQRVF